MQTTNPSYDIKVTGRHISITQAIKDYARRKIEGLHLNYPKIIDAHVILDVEKHRHFAEINLVCNNHVRLDAKAETDDVYASIDEAISRIARQMRKEKTRVLKSHRPGVEE